MDVNVIARSLHRSAKTDPAERVFHIADHLVGGAENARAGRMYVGDDYRAVVITLAPGDSQEPTCIPRPTTMVLVSGTARSPWRTAGASRGAGIILGASAQYVHGLRNTADDNFVYIAVSIGA